MKQRRPHAELGQVVIVDDVCTVYLQNRFHPIVAKVLGTEVGQDGKKRTYLDRRLPVAEGCRLDGYDVDGSVSTILTIEIK